MDTIQLPDLAGFDWAGLFEKVQTLGIDFDIKAITAVVIFLCGTDRRTLRCQGHTKSDAVPEI